jgi:transcriptional regulator with XRE-family HTH domain
MSRKKVTDKGTFLGYSSRLRKIRGDLSQEEFGKIFGVRKMTISRYEAGRIPDVETLKKIADYGGVTVEWLLYGDKVNVLAQIRDEALELCLHPDTIPEAKDIIIRNYHQTAMALREQLDLKNAEIAELRQSKGQLPQLTERAPEIYDATPLPFLAEGALTEVIAAAENYYARHRLKRRPIQKARLIIRLYQHYAETREKPDDILIKGNMPLAD